MVDTANTGPDGLERALSGDYALVVLDVMMPGMGGIELLQEFRARSNVLVLMLTAKGEEVDPIIGLEMGADRAIINSFGHSGLDGGLIWMPSPETLSSCKSGPPVIKSRSLLDNSTIFAV